MLLARVDAQCTGFWVLQNVGANELREPLFAIKFQSCSRKQQQQQKQQQFIKVFP